MVSQLVLPGKGQFAAPCSSGLQGPKTHEFLVSNMNRFMPCLVILSCERCTAGLARERFLVSVAAQMCFQVVAPREYLGAHIALVLAGTGFDLLNLAWWLRKLEVSVYVKSVDFQHVSVPRVFARKPEGREIAVRNVTKERPLVTVDVLLSLGLTLEAMMEIEAVHSRSHIVEAWTVQEMIEHRLRQDSWP